MDYINIILSIVYLAFMVLTYLGKSKLKQTEMNMILQGMRFVLTTLSGYQSVSTPSGMRFKKGNQFVAHSEVESGATRIMLGLQGLATILAGGGGFMQM